MGPRLRIPASLASALPVRDAERCGLELVFQPRRPGDALVDFADLGAEPTLASVRGLAQLTRLLRATRIAAPQPLATWRGDPERAAAWVSPARGRELVLVAAPRSCVRFSAWTEEGVLCVDHVAEVLADERNFWVRRVGGRPLAQIARGGVLRQETAAHRWLDLVSIEPAARAAARVGG